MQIKYPFSIDPVDPADRVTGRELHVTDGTGASFAMSLAPTASGGDFTVPIVEGGSGVAVLVDVNDRGPSDPSPAVTFSTSTPGPVNVPGQPNAPILGEPIVIPDSDPGVPVTNSFGQRGSAPTQFAPRRPNPVQFGATRRL